MELIGELAPGWNLENKESVSAASGRTDSTGRTIYPYVDTTTTQDLHGGKWVLDRDFNEVWPPDLRDPRHPEHMTRPNVGPTGCFW